MILVRIYFNNIPVSHIPTKPKKLVRPIISSNNSTPSFQTKPKTKITKETTNYSLPLSACSSFFSTLASVPNVLYNILDPPLHAWLGPTHVYAGNLAPVDEMEPTDCPVIEGKLPVSLKGVYIRNGPNPQLRVIPRALLLFDGDGMLHSLRFSDGHATYCCRYVKTYKFLLEREAGFPVVPNVFSGFFGFGDILRFLMATRRIVTGHFNLMNGFGVANTGLAFFANKLFALCESDLPYAIDLTQRGDIETLGRWEFEKKLMSNMTAHPKVDMDTKETFAFSWSLTFPHLTFFRFDEKGVKQKQVAISSIKQPCFIHDFAITKTFAIFHETQLIYSIGKVTTGRGTLVDYEPNKIPRIGIIPKYAMNDSDMKWFQVPGFNTIHIINAWENGDDEIVFVASNIVSVDNIFKSTVNVSLEKVNINIKTGEISRDIISPRNLEFGSINPCYVGRETRFAYLGVLEEVPKMSGIVKIDLETGQEVAKRFYGPNCFGGEPLFVRRDGESNNSDEDDGYVMTYVHDEKANESKFIIMDAKSSELEIMTVIEVPRRVPYGFHGLFVCN
ncbi:Carotenoid oxygenase [Corchorus capsularis]|uniref:Carotenoid oxygenase n=1 Tax=Corchorus capsularis TaxID=210143 RepID=A0A1R3G0L5_COCAP|nr:Carotenoid oxygenase [Corchorus capsularis]